MMKRTSPEAGEISLAPYKRRGFAGAQCGVRKASSIHPELAVIEKAMHQFEGLWMDSGLENRGGIFPMFNRPDALQSGLAEQAVDAEAAQRFYNGIG